MRGLHGLTEADTPAATKYEIGEIVEKLKLEIRLLFGSDIDSTDACIKRLLAVLKTESGIDSAHLAVSPGGHPCRSLEINDCKTYKTYFANHGFDRYNATVHFVHLR